MNKSRALIFRLTGSLVLVFAAFAGFNLAVVFSQHVLSQGQLAALIFTLFPIAGLLSLLTAEGQKLIGSRPGCGVIYIMRRDDGVLKFGKTHHLKKRLKAHRRDYRAGFEVVSTWIVPDTDRFEELALSLTGAHAYHEARRKELRQMSDSELTDFILEFTNKVHGGWMQ